MPRKFSSWGRAALYFALKRAGYTQRHFRMSVGTTLRPSEWLNQDKLVKYFSKAKSNDLRTVQVLCL